MDQDLLTKDASACLPTDEIGACQDSSGKTLNCDINGHETDGVGQRDDKDGDRKSFEDDDLRGDRLESREDGEQLDAVVEGDTHDSDSNLEDGDRKNSDEGDQVEGQEDCDLHGSKLDTEVDGEMHGEMEEPEDGFPCGDELDTHNGEGDDGFQCGDEQNDKDGDELQDSGKCATEVDGDTNQTETQQDDDTHDDHRDADIDNVDQDNHIDDLDDGYNISGEDPPFGSLTRVETNADMPDEEEEEESKLLDEDNVSDDDDNKLFDEDNKFPEDLISALSPASLLEDQVEADIDTSLAEDGMDVSNQSDGTGQNDNVAERIADEIPNQDLTAEECKDNMDVDESKIIDPTNMEEESNQLDNETPKMIGASQVEDNAERETDDVVNSSLNSGLDEEENTINDGKVICDGAVVNDLKEGNIDEDVDVQSMSLESQTVPSDNNKSILNVCSNVVEEIINKVLTDVENRKEEAMDVDVNEKDVSSEGLKPDISDNKHSVSDKQSEKEASDGVICLSSDDDTEVVSGKAKASSNGAQPKNTNDGSLVSKTKNANSSTAAAAAAEEEDDIMVIEETSSAPAKKPPRIKTPMDNSSSAKRCKLCKKVFISADQLRKHVREAHGLIMIDKEQVLRCRICSFRGVWSVFVKHLAEKHPSSSHLVKDVDKDKRMPCGICSYRGQKAELDKHMEEKHPGVIVRSPKKFNATTPTKVNDPKTQTQDNSSKSPYTLRPRKQQPPPPPPPSTTKEILPKKDSYTVTHKSPLSSASLITKKISWTQKQSSMLVGLNKSESDQTVAAEGIKKQKAFFEKLVVDGFKIGKRQIRLDVLLEKCDKTVFECGLCQQSFPNYLQVYFHQKVCLPAPDKSSRIIVYLPFETIMSQFLYKAVGPKKFLQCVHCSNRVSAQNVSALIQALHLSVHVVPEVIIRTYYNGVVNNRIGHARQDSNKKAYSWDEVLKPVSVNRSSVVSSRNNNLDRYICTSGRLHQMESRHVLNDDLHDFGKIHSSSSDDESELWETTYRRRKYGKKKKKVEFLSPNSKQKQSLLASVNYKLTSKRQHEREQRMNKRDDQKRRKDKKRDDNDSNYELNKPAPHSMQKLSFDEQTQVTMSKTTSASTLSWKRTSNDLEASVLATKVMPQEKLRSLLTSEETVYSVIPDDSDIPLNEFGGSSADDNYFPELEGLVEENKGEPEPENDGGNLPEEVPAEEEEPLRNTEEQEKPPQETEEDLGPLLTEEDLAEYWRLFEDDEDTPTGNDQCENLEKPIVPETQTMEVNSEESKSIISLLTSLPQENDVLDYYGGSKQPLSDKSVVFMTTQHVFKYFTLMPVDSSNANFACNLRGCTAVFASTLDMAAHLGRHFPLRVIIQDFPSTSIGHVVPLITTKQVLQHYRGRKTNNDDRLRYSCCYKRCNATSILDQSLAVHLLKHFQYVCTGNILLRKADFAGHPLLSHYKCLRGARQEHSSIFQLTCKECEFFVTTYIFKGKIGEVVEAELSAHALSHGVGMEAEEALRKMCRATSKQPHQAIKLQDKPVPKVISKPTQKTVLMSPSIKTQTQDAKRTVSVTEPELLKKFGAASGGWKCLVKHCGFLHRGVKDLFIFANHLRRHILGCKKIIVMKKKTPVSSTANRIPQGPSKTNIATTDKHKPIDVVTIDDGSDDEKAPSKSPPDKNEIKKDSAKNDTGKAPISDKENVKACNVKVVLNKLPLDTAIMDKIEAMKTTKPGDGTADQVDNNSKKRKLNDDDDDKSGKKSCVEESMKEDAETAADGDDCDLANGEHDENELTNGEDPGTNEPSTGTKRKREETHKTADTKSLRLSPADVEDIKDDLESRQSEEENDIEDENQSQNDDENDLVDPSMEKLITELKSTDSDPIILPISTVERFFKKAIQSNLNRSSGGFGTMNFTCLMCRKTGFKGKDFELVRHLESHIGKKISLKMKELQVKDTKEDDTASPKAKSKSNTRSLVHHDLEGLRKCPEDKIQLHFEEVENFYVKNVRLSRSKSELSYGVIMYTCVDCSKGDLKTEHLVKHLEDHVDKTIKLIRNPTKSNGPTPS